MAKIKFENQEKLREIECVQVPINRIQWRKDRLKPGNVKISDDLQLIREK